MDLHELGTGTAAENPAIHVFNENNYLIRIVLRGGYPNITASAGWINEKLLFIRVWWGRINATDMIFDVESEKTIYREHLTDGTLPFNQFKEYKEQIQQQIEHAKRAE